MPFERVAVCFKLPAHNLEVIDLAIIGNHVAFAGRAHWLGTGHGEIDYREATMPQSDSSLIIDPYTTGIRPPVYQPGRHTFDTPGQISLSGPPGTIEKTGYPTHYRK